MLASFSTSGQANRSCFIRPVSLNSAGFRPRGATGPKSTTSALGLPARCTRAKPIPPSPEFHGSTAARASAVATAASTALPPASRTATPASAALLACETTIPRRPLADGLEVTQFCVKCGDGVKCIDLSWAFVASRATTIPDHHQCQKSPPPERPDLAKTPHGADSPAGSIPARGHHGTPGYRRGPRSRDQQARPRRHWNGRYRRLNRNIF